MLSDLESFLLRLATERAVVVTVGVTRGSVPRETGAWMAVFGGATGGAVGTIGGGHLEWDAMRHAREALGRNGGERPRVWSQAVTLGPSLGQCCGGALVLHFESVDASDVDALRQRLTQGRAPLALFGGGHVGRALVQALAPLPFDVTWIDSRDEVFPADLPGNVRAEYSEPVQYAVRGLVRRSHVLVMSFSHAEDLDIVAACLLRLRQSGDLGFVGLIGSKTKWATFRRRLRQRGFSDAELARVTCPIGLPGIEGKAPAVIAASVVAQLLLECQATSDTPVPP
ncbi:xanthine dehydrogenase accessory protein XdhC [Hydrogenophaga laconesensis]|uniref:Xanthine dehydrogenase accessory factor n=1 Tax=Hydrogenophaga laconesensis TaxID=1805971 RepID=A0ABU1VBL5_9BURK|nr:xanthine dehydrogenase accessory protein XdhC [Hydrogenophaga laconesensis]MDR7094840.1 xanthine dehydrogenase accessory factor [Hydrogenophaga laconesensis]